MARRWPKPHLAGCLARAEATIESVGMLMTGAGVQGTP